MPCNKSFTWESNLKRHEKTHYDIIYESIRKEEDEDSKEDLKLFNIAANPIVNLTVG